MYDNGCRFIVSLCAACGIPFDGLFYDACVYTENFVNVSHVFENIF